MSRKLRRFLLVHAALGNRSILKGAGAVAASALVSAALTPAHAEALHIAASVAMDADVSLNSGWIQAGVDIPPGMTTALTGSTESAVDDPAASNASDSYSQVGNPYTDPPTPFIATAYDETTQADGDQARGLYYVESTITPDYALRPVLVERTLTSTAELTFADIDTDASALSGFEIGRDLVLTNTSETTAYGFTITTGYDVNLAASADALGSQSVAEIIYSLSFITSGTVFLDYGGTFAESTSIDDSDPGVSVMQNLVTSNALFDGVYYTASVSATGTGAPTEASLDAISRFYFDVMMSPGSSLRLSFFQSEQSMTSYVDPTVSEVPLPASALLFLGGLGFLVRRQRKAAS